MEISPKFVAFSEYMNFNRLNEQCEQLINFNKTLSHIKDEIEDIQEEVFENTEEMEVDLCALINENFRMDDDYWFDESDAFYVKRNSRMSVEDD